MRDVFGEHLAARLAHEEGDQCPPLADTDPEWQGVCGHAEGPPVHESVGNPGARGLFLVTINSTRRPKSEAVPDAQTSETGWTGHSE
ncbi:pyrimidine-nucleoside phosphorylase [Novosphingobium sp. PY1]|nr:pyrimidine-nucleoside phosphorylase [Novosphingobium sp. PY1]